MKEQLKKQDMVVGKQYKGYAWRNEYGEFFFRPSAVGDRLPSALGLVRK